MGEIELIKSQFEQKNDEWHQFLKSITISNIHGWTGQKMIFNFPVVAVVGENGIGKSTFLKAAVCAYKNKLGKDFYPSKMFVNTQWDTEGLKGANIEYEVKNGNQQLQLRWRKTQDWGFAPKGKKPERNVYFLDISRTVPLDATVGYAKIAKAATEEIHETDLSDESRKELSFILGHEYISARFTATDFDSNKEIGLLSKGDREISQFHQGAGEDTIFDTIRLIQDMPNQSLLVIDEVENSLHPEAQRRYIKFLLRVARKKKMQIILSTHSYFVLEELPEKARIMLMPVSGHKEIVYHVSPQFALSTMDERAHAELFVFVEDKEAETLFWEILKLSGPEKFDEYSKKIEVHAVGSASVIKVLSDLCLKGKLPYKSVAIVDGDKRKDFPECLAFPGQQAPERQIFEDLKKINWNDLEKRFGIGAGNLYKYLSDAMLLLDPHEWTTKVGDIIKCSKDEIWSVLVSEWVKQCLQDEEKQEFIDSIDNALL